MTRPDGVQRPRFGAILVRRWLPRRTVALALVSAGCRPNAPTHEAAEPRTSSAQFARDTHEPVGPAVQRVTGRLIAGDDFTCTLDSAGAAWCWGNNDRGQLGDGSELPSTHPVRVAGLNQAKMLAGGEDHACALLAGGEVWCWGANASGELGDRTTLPRRSPVRAHEIGPATTIFAGRGYTCASTRRGVECWGDAPAHTDPPWTMRQRGTFDPVPVPELRHADFACGYPDRACAIDGGRILCWGHIGWHLSVGTRWLTGIDDAIAVTCTGTTTCGLDRDGRMQCIAGPEMNMREGPLDRAVFDRFPRAIALADNGGMGCLLDRSGAPWCWPSALDPRHGAEARTRMFVAERLGTRDGFVGLAIGGWGHVCALAPDGAVACAGDNSWGQAGGGVPLFALTPEPVDGVKGISGLTAAGDRTCGILGGEVRCWGDLTAVIPPREPALADVTRGPATAVALAAESLCVQRPDNQVECSDGQVIRATRPPRQIDPNSTCLLGQDGIVTCKDGRFDARSFDRGEPAAEPPRATDVVELASNTSPWTGMRGVHCGRRSSGRVTCVKADKSVLRSGDVEIAGRAGKPAPLRDATRLVAIGHELCALRRNGQVVCWIADDRFKLLAEPIAGLGEVVEFVRGGWHQCARLRDGRVRCWGGNRCGQLGDGTVAERPAPGVVVFDGAVEIAAGLCHTCARKSTGDVWCWGRHGGEPRTGQARPTSYHQDLVPVPTSAVLPSREQGKQHPAQAGGGSVGASVPTRRP